MPLEDKIGYDHSSKVDEHLKDENLLSDDAMKRSKDNVSSKVPPHLKDNNMSSMVPQHQKEKEFGAARLSRRDKFEIESKNKKLGTAQMRRKERLSFRQRNGAAYQVPNDWEELYDEKTTHKVTNNKMTKGKSDYCNSLKQKVFNDWNEICEKKNTHEIDAIKTPVRKGAANNETFEPKMLSGKKGQFNPKTIKKNNSRWNGTELKQIEADKSKLLDWYENGIITDATTHKTRNFRSKSETDNSSVDRKVKSRPITLGDFLPNIKIQSKSDLNLENNDLQSDDSKSQQPAQISECKENSENVSSIDSKPELKRSYLFVSRLPDDELKEVSTKLSTGPFISQLPDGDELNEVKTKTFDTQKQKSFKTHFCIYGIHYYAKRVCDSLFTQVDSLLDMLPQRQLENFADAFRQLISGIENLRFSHYRHENLKCFGKYCRWREIEISADEPIERCFSHSPFGLLSDLLAFEVKLTNVSENEYRLKKLLGDDYNKDDFRITYLMKRHKKALDLIEVNKSKSFAERIDQFTNILFREVFILFESLPEDESCKLRKSINRFNESAWKMRELENQLKEGEDLQCCIPFRKQMSCETKAQSSTVSKTAQEKEGSTSSSNAYSVFEFKTRREYRKVFPLPKPESVELVLTQKRDLLMKNGSKIPEWMSEQCKPTTMTSPCAELEQCKPTGIVTQNLFDQCSPTVTTYDKYHSDEWEHSTDEGYVKPPELSHEEQTEMYSHFTETIKRLKGTDENVLDDRKIDSNTLNETNVLNDDNISDDDSSECNLSDFEYSSERDEEKYTYCTSPGCTYRSRKLSPSSYAIRQKVLDDVADKIVEKIFEQRRSNITESSPSELKTEEVETNETKQ